MAFTDYIGVSVTCTEDFRDILIAELAALGYESMLETDTGVEAYLDEVLFNKSNMDALIAKYSDRELSYKVEKVATRNWNEEWEKNYDPIEVGKMCIVRAAFHPPSADFKYEIIINPRMSFGTGHHSTTYLMLEQQMDLAHQGKRVLDAGCGTAILAVMAEKLGAADIVAYDNNSWTIENAPENLALNHCNRISIQEGTIATIDISGQFDIILANINKNVLLDELGAYESYLRAGGVLILSGFYQADEADLIRRAAEFGLISIKARRRNDWSTLQFEKK